MQTMDTRMNSPAIPRLSDNIVRTRRRREKRQRLAGLQHDSDPSRVTAFQETKKKSSVFIKIQGARVMKSQKSSLFLGKKEERKNEKYSFHDLLT